MDTLYLMICLVAGGAAGAVIAILSTRGKEHTLRALLQSEKEERRLEREQSTRRELSMREEHERRTIQLRNENQQRIEVLKGDAKRQLAELREQQEREVQILKRDYERRIETELDELKESYITQIKLMREQLATSTEKILKDRVTELQNANTVQMDTIFAPIKDNIRRMEQSITETRETSVRNHASFEKTIEQMMQQTSSLSVQADRLSNALQRRNKTVGNWGELILTELLESQGLEEGIHYDVQYTLRDAEGRTVLNTDTGARMVPDVVLHLADRRDLIIDSKMSMTAFVDYQNAETEAERADAGHRLVESVNAHIKELTAKKYHEYISSPRVSCDFVIMFAPIEAALQLAISLQPDLWQKAFEKRVLLVGSQTLVAALHIIDLTWVNVRQEQNTMKIMEEARKLVERVEQFYQRFQTVGKKIAEVNDAYKDVMDKVKDGRQSILGAGQSLERLGVRGKR
ncbi:MAG: DNA recombination protein RmuC [Muribaculaceae bacterium]|nr:DNA recombination protein RmuC [Muribaculaceae bacterium]